jgi:hypothetical protein
MATHTIRREFKVNDVPTDVTSAKLSDATGTYGVKRSDTNAVVVADNTDMAHDSTGVYSYTFTVVAGVAYTAAIEFVYDGSTYRDNLDIPSYSIAAAAVTTSTDEVGNLQTELGEIRAARAAVYAGNAGAPYSISTPEGSESVDVTAYLRYLHDREEWILQRLQDLQPFMVIQSRRIGRCRY